MPGHEDCTGTTLTLPVATASVEAACHAALAAVGGRRLSPHTLTTLELVIEEVVMNVVRHAYDDPAGRAFRFQVEVPAGAASMALTFEDDGRPFDPTRPVRSIVSTRLEDAEPGGLGLPLLHKRARSMRYLRIDGVNRLTLEVDLTHA